MAIISKRARQKAAVQEPEIEVVSSSIIIIGSDAQLSPEQIKRAEEIFREIRRQLDAIGIASAS